jgi:PAS domain-containing protein
MGPLPYGVYLERVHPHDGTRIESGMKWTLEQDADYRVDHGVFWIQTYGQVIAGEAGTLMCTIGISRDITTEKQNQEPQ